MSGLADGNDIDRIEQQLRWTLSKVERDVEDAVQRADQTDAEQLMQQLDGDIEELEGALDGLRAVLRQRAAGQPVALHAALSNALDAVLGEVETPLSITSSVAADLPVPAMPRIDLISLCERSLRLLTRVAVAGDELRISASTDGGDLVAMEVELRPFDADRLPTILGELERTSETLAEFVVDHGGRMVVDREGAATIRLALPCLVGRA